MGSLMAGWDSPKLSSSKRGFERKGSFTRSEIDMFWRSRHEQEDRHMREATEISKRQAQHSQQSKSQGVTERELVQQELERSLEKMASSNDWWTKSSWAFLNEPRFQAVEVIDQSRVLKK